LYLVPSARPQQTADRSRYRDLNLRSAHCRSRRRAAVLKKITPKST